MGGLVGSSVGTVEKFPTTRKKFINSELSPPPPHANYFGICKKNIDSRFISKLRGNSIMIPTVVQSNERR